MAKRTDTIKDYHERMNKVMMHIQRNLDAPLTLDELSRIACFSPFHFHRLFAAMVGEPLSQHVRRLRLERAAIHLCHSPASVTDLALGAGYETPSAFNKAFRQLFGENPTSFRRGKGRLFRNPLLDARARTTTTKENKVEATMVERPDKKVVFVRKTGPYQKAAGEAWGALCRFAGPHGLMGPGVEFIGIGYDDPSITAEDKLRYEACMTVDREVKPEGEVGVQTLKGGRFAKFLHKGPYDRLSETYHQIYAQWLPACGAKLRDVPGFELYLDDCAKVRPDDLRTEIYVPVQ